MEPRNVLAMISPMDAKRVSGIAQYAKEHGWTLMRRGIPLVDLTVNRPKVKVPRATSDHREIGRLAAQHFAEREFRHIAWFSSGWGNVHKLRYQGLSEAATENPLKWVVADEIPAQRQSEWSSFVAWIRERLAAADKPLAVLTYDETDDARLLYAAKELGVNVPEELAILSIGNNPLIGENLAKPIGSPQIAEALELKRSELDRLFRPHLMRSVGAEIRRQRFARVKLLLETTERSISDIARITGYCTPSHLTNAFKSAFGQSPKDWRRNRQTQL